MFHTSLASQEPPLTTETVELALVVRTCKYEYVADSRIFKAVEEFHFFSPFCSVISFHQKLLFSHLIVDPCCLGVCGQGGGGRVAERTRSQQCRVAFAESEGRKI